MHRDLACQDVWEDSLQRSRARREAAAARPAPGLPAKQLSVAAAVAVVGGPVAAVGVGAAVSGDDSGASEARASAAAPKAKPAPKRAAPELNVPARPAPPKARVSTTQSAAKPKPRTVPVAVVARRPDGVAAVQRKLGVPVDGDFGAKTERALARWQRAHGLDADGRVGPATRAALGLRAGRVLEREKPRRAAKRRKAKRRPEPRVRAASRSATRGGSGVRGLQRALGQPADGVFGPSTERALERWQRKRGLEADGVAGPQTRAKLGLGEGPPLKRKRSEGRRKRSGGRSRGGGGGSSVVARVVAAANQIATKPYRYGGGHGSFQDSGYDCSGSVSYALHGGGLLSSPLDSTGFMSYGKPGPGKRITIYANPGHVFMTIDGRRFDTSARRQSGSRWGGPRSGSGYTVRHPAGY